MTNVLTFARGAARRYVHGDLVTGELFHVQAELIYTRVSAQLDRISPRDQATEKNIREQLKQAQKILDRLWLLHRV